MATKQQTVGPSQQRDTEQLLVQVPEVELQAHHVKCGATLKSTTENTSLADEAIGPELEEPPNAMSEVDTVRQQSAPESRAGPPGQQQQATRVVLQEMEEGGRDERRGRKAVVDSGGI